MYVFLCLYVNFHDLHEFTSNIYVYVHLSTCICVFLCLNVTYVNLHVYMFTLKSVYTLYLDLENSCMYL